MKNRQKKIANCCNSQGFRKNQFLIKNTFLSLFERDEFHPHGKLVWCARQPAARLLGQRSRDEWQLRMEECHAVRRYALCAHPTSCSPLWSVNIYEMFNHSNFTKISSWFKKKYLKWKTPPPCLPQFPTCRPRATLTNSSLLLKIQTTQTYTFSELCISLLVSITRPQYPPRSSEGVAS